MTRKKIQIKKIDNIAARQVAFSKRRKGLFKKAKELAILCDAEIGLFVFSASGKLFDYASSSMQGLLERHNSVHSENLPNLNEPSVELQLESNMRAKLNEEVEKKTHELRQMKGEELQGLGMEELKKLEKSLQGGLNRVSEMMDGRNIDLIHDIERKVDMLVEENQRLNQLEVEKMTDQMQNMQGNSSESIVNNCSSSNPSQDYDSSDTSLKLGLPSLEY
ncbi:MADS-box protein JOINTLESS-like isoform X2 [Momordica charantia]|uniref:MADS-box protein JOINTLESS-like isoform X2 n=1 Tax=Momordica charantia TaxID=3673 RepID=A0A6J1CLA0_MOMCH|nr:MADS-box protein JOINTLESS-like isoform X2 [Momordica charantia]